MRERAGNERQLCSGDPAKFVELTALQIWRLYSIPPHHADAGTVFRRFDDDNRRFPVFIEGVEPAGKPLKQDSHGDTSLEGSLINAIDVPWFRW